MTQEHLKYTDQSRLDQLAKSWTRMVNCISHDLTTPLAILRLVGHNIEKTLTDLLEGYKLAVQHNLMEPKVNESHIQAIEGHVITSVRENVNKMQEFLNILHPYNQQLLSTAPETVQLSAKAAVESALKRYPFFDDRERALVHVDFSCDFTFSCAPVFIEGLLDHLLRNAFYAIRNVGKGEINIWAEEERDYYTLHFKDSASGMSEDLLTRVFERFFSKRDDDKIIPGLGFCKLALAQRGRDVLCHSVDGQFTDFVIKFPKAYLRISKQKSVSISLTTD